MLVAVTAGDGAAAGAAAASGAQSRVMVAVPRHAGQTVKPVWHAPWTLYRVIAGHLGWVRCLAVEPGNEWFATGSVDRIIKASVSLCSPLLSSPLLSCPLLFSLCFLRVLSCLLLPFLLLFVDRVHT